MKYYIVIIASQVLSYCGALKHLDHALTPQVVSYHSSSQYYYYYYYQASLWDRAQRIKKTEGMHGLFFFFPM